MAKESLELDRWARERAPSTELRRWFGHDPNELAEKTGMLKGWPSSAARGSLVLLYGARDEKHNQAVVLKEVLEEGIRKS